MSSGPDVQRSFEQQLHEKNELVEALTAQLEKTVNQLDRLRRTGADRAGSLSSESSSSSVEISARLSTALSEWDELQPAAHLSRIEQGIDQILDLLHQRTADPANAATLTQESHGSFWEEAKARLLEENPPSESSDVESEPDESAETVYFKAEDLQREMAPEPEIQPLPEPPPPIDHDADAEELIEAVETRDKYIQYLIGRLRTAESNKHVPVDWEQLASAPDDFRKRLEGLERLLKDQLKQAEIANSLERAVLTRERAKLTQVKQSLETHIRRMNATGGNESQESGASNQSDPDRRWKRIFSR